MVFYFSNTEVNILVGMELMMLLTCIVGYISQLVTVLVIIANDRKYITNAVSINFSIDLNMLFLCVDCLQYTILFHTCTNHNTRTVLYNKTDLYKTIIFYYISCMTIIITNMSMVLLAIFNVVPTVFNHILYLCIVSIIDASISIGLTQLTIIRINKIQCDILIELTSINVIA